MKLIVGLGNPGSKYAGTRHNIGFDVLDYLARQHQVSLAQERFHAWFGRGTIAGQPVVLLKPTTFMNRSGQAVQAAGRFYKLALEDLLVILDDLALPVGKLRLRPQGSAGSHNGLQDIVDRLGSQDFARLRIGIGAATIDPAAYVLARFSPQEQEAVAQAIPRAAEAVTWWLADGTESTMNRINAPSA